MSFSTKFIRPLFNKSVAMVALFMIHPIKAAINNGP